MNKQTLFVTLTTAALMCGCQSSKVKISGRFVGGDAKNIYLEQVLPLTQSVVDSAALAPDGSYRMELTGVAKTPSLYNVIYDGERIPLLLAGGDRLTLGSVGSVIRNYTVEGSSESELLRQFYQAFVTGAQQLENMGTEFARKLTDEERKSLIKEYTTKAGRKVYDGGGVMPDIRMPDNYYSRFTNVLYGKGYIEDFANLYYKKHREGVDVDNFELSDADYNEFVRFMADKPVDFESETQQTLSQLRQKAERDKYLDRIEGELNAIEQKIRDDKQADLQAFKKEIKELIGDEIVMRYHYIQGVARHNSHLDPEILEAIKVLQDPARYHQIITSQDTQRK